MFRLIKTEGRARRGEFTCPHGTVQTPVFMNVGTQGAIKGALSARDLADIGCQVELSNTYHLHVRPGDELIKSLGGLHRFMTWDGPILTDSGGFQIFSLAQLRKIGEDGVRFNCHVDGRHIFMGPEESMRIQSNLGSDIAMAFDECIKIPSPYEYVRQSCDRTVRWLERCKRALAEYNSEPDAVNPGQVLFGINQGAVFHDIRNRGSRGAHAQGQTEVSHGRRHAGEYHRERVARRGLLRLRHARAKRTARAPVHLGRDNQHQKRQIRARRGADIAGMRLPRVQEIFKGLRAASVQGGGNARHALRRDA